MKMLKALEQQEKELIECLNVVRKEINEEKLRLAEQEYGVRVGSIVKDSKGVEHKVIFVNVRYGDKPWLEGNPKKKDGKFGTARRNIYTDWSLVSS
jgi:hypothetical protein